MSKVTLAAVGSLQDTTTAENALNSNTAAIVTAIDNTLSRDGSSPNQMLANLDMNSHRILNLPQPISGSEPLRLTDLSLVPGNSTVNISPLPVGGSLGQVLTKNSSTNYDVSWTSSSSSSFNVIQFGADPTGSLNSATAINNAINAARASAGVVFIPSGSYDVSGGINATDITNGMTIQGGGATSTVLFVQSSTNAILDMTGSADVGVKDLQINGNHGTVANFGILQAASTINPSDVNSFINVSITGSWIKAGAFIYGSSDGYWQHCQISNFNPTASACLYIAATNDLSATSSFTTIQTGTLQSGDWLFDGQELHDISQVSGTSTVVPLFISGNFSPIKYIGGVIAGSVAAANGGMVTFGGTPTGGVTFIGVQFYGDNGTPSKYAFWTYNTFTGLIVQGCSIQYGTALMSGANGSIWSSLNITGNASMGSGPVITMPSGNTSLTRSVIDCQSLALNLGASGVLIHSVLLQPGTITAGTQVNNGIF